MSTTQTGWSRYAARWAERHGGYDLRRAPGPVRRWQRAAYRVGRLLAAVRVPVVAVTVMTLLVAVAVPVLADRGGSWPLVAAGAVLVATFGGAVESALGVLRSGGGPAAAIRGTVAARLRELSWLVALWSVGAGGPLLVACGALTWLHEYVRIQALAARLSRIGMQTVGDPPMRPAVAAVGLALAGLAGDELAGGVATVAGAVWLLLAALGLGQLLGAVRRSLG